MVSKVFFSKSTDDITEQFDMISIIYVIEHMTDPVTLLQKLKPYLKPDGILFVQTSEFLANPFDLLVVDHCSHFQEKSLEYAVNLAGFKSVIRADGWIDKEIGIIAEPMRGGTSEKESEIISDLKGDSAEKALAWLDEVQKQVAEISRKGPFGVFGTALAGTWIAGSLEDRIDFFVDEDPLRQGKTHMGIKVYHPEDVPAGALVYLAFPTTIAKKIYNRLQKEYPHIKFIIPLPWKK